MNPFQIANQYLYWNQHLAGWAQFAGAMLALGATFFAAWMPVWDRRRAEAERQIRLRQSAVIMVASIAAAIDAVIGAILEHFDQIGEHGIPTHFLNAAVKDVENFPVNEIQDPSIRHDLISLRTIATGLLESIPDYIKLSQLEAGAGSIQVDLESRRSIAQRIRDQLTKTLST